MTNNRANFTDSKLVIEFGGHSATGPKSRNDDAYSAHLPEDHSSVELKGAVACIADGVSNSEQSQVASQTSVTHFIADYYSTPESWSVQQSAGRVINSINSWLYNYGSATHTRTDSAVTTLSAAIIKSQTAYIVHAGDSRIYLYRDGKLEALTRDHSQKRGKDESYLTRALGIDTSLDVDYRKEPIKENDLLLLSTDGLHEFMSEKDIKVQLDEYLNQTKKISLETSAHKMVGHAIKSGSDDNTSCLLVHIKQLPIENLDEIHRRLTSTVIPPVLKIGNKIDHFTIKRILHSSTRSHVYLAEDQRDGTRVVLKAPSENFADDTQYLDSFRKEYWLGRKLNSRYVMKILPQSDNTRFTYHVCEYIEGQTLRQWMIDNPQPSLDSVRTIAKEIANALRVLHRNSVIHRDLKPENILLDQDSNIKLIDLGTAQIAGLDEVVSPLTLDNINNIAPVGDIDYIAPEYLLGGTGNNQSDLFSLGCIVYEMLSGELPYNVIKSNKHLPSRLDQWEYHPFINQGKTPLPAWLNKVLEKSTAANPEKRYIALSEFINDLFKPSKDILGIQKNKPLIERNPLLFWKIITTILISVIITQWVYIRLAL